MGGGRRGQHTDVHAYIYIYTLQYVAVGRGRHEKAWKVLTENQPLRRLPEAISCMEATSRRPLRRT